MNYKTPMMLQWAECKEKAAGALLLFRLGDFYEAFEEDAKVLSRELELTLTKRQEIPMAGIPFHAAESYIDTLLEKGYRVAIAEQTEDAKQAKGLVKREIVRIVSPGTSFTEGAGKTNRFFIALAEVGRVFGLSVLDLTTGEFRAAEFETLGELMTEGVKLNPKEVLTTAKFRHKYPSLFAELKKASSPLVTDEAEWRFELSFALGTLTRHFNTHSLDGFGLKGQTAAICTSGALLSYVRDCLCQSTSHLRQMHTWSNKEFLFIDRISQRNLELTESLYDKGRSGTLLECLDNTKTAMGARLLQGWVKQPLFSVDKIEARQEAIASILGLDISSLQEKLAQIRDLERLVWKISSNLASPRDISSLKDSLLPLASLKVLLKGTSSSLIQILEEELSPLKPLTDLIERALVDEPPARVQDGSIFKRGYSDKLDELKELSTGSKEWLAAYQTELKEATGIRTLKVGFTKISGFYIEISRGQADKAPPHFRRRQTLTSAERYITPELKEYEEKILGAEEKALQLELELFEELKKQILPHLDAIFMNAHAIAHLDALQSLALVAKRWGWVRPKVQSGPLLEIREGRHPILEMKGSERFIPNDTWLDQETVKLMLITGPNMAGKSTYIRQTALIVILAQMGAFVPALSASIGLVDKLFTRIGASDDLARGQSTFMVEMTETANILNNATSHSLVILDEIGRGTSTYDGISIAWSVAEWLLTQKGKAPKTLFATHFWELTKLEEQVAGAKNFTVAVCESGSEIRFLRKIIPGGTDKSYGIHVAKLAGLPIEVIARATEILSHLEETAKRDKIFEPAKPKPSKKKISNERQLVLF